LSYTVGLEQVFLNGVNLVRGQDYTATNGTSVGSLTALVASDVVEVFAYVPFNIANALTVSTVDAKGDLLVGTADNTIGKLTAGTDGQILSAASGETTGLKWANPGLTLIKTETFSAVGSVNVNDVFSATYDNYRILIKLDSASTNVALRFRWRVSGSDASGASDYRFVTTGYSSANSNQSGTSLASYFEIGASNSTDGAIIDLVVKNPNVASKTLAVVTTSYSYSTTYYVLNESLTHLLSTAYTGFTLFTDTGNVTGSVSIYGFNK
jgi:hypothetical protein